VERQVLYVGGEFDSESTRYKRESLRELLFAVLANLCRKWARTWSAKVANDASVIGSEVLLFKSIIAWDETEYYKHKSKNGEN